MPRILVECPSTREAVATGYRTQDVDLTAPLQPRAFRCSCGQVHTWDAKLAWVEEGLTDSARRVYGLAEHRERTAAELGIA